MATVAILTVLIKSDEGALHTACSAPGAMKLWEGICQLLGRKMEMERKYIERLEGELVCNGTWCECHVITGCCFCMLGLGIQLMSSSQLCWCEATSCGCLDAVR